MRIEAGRRLLVACLVVADKGLELHGDVFKRVVGVLEPGFYLLVNAVASRRIGRDHDVIRRHDLGEGPFVPHDVFDELHRLAGHSLATVGPDLAVSFLAFFLIRDVLHQFLILSPVPCLAEVLVGERDAGIVSLFKAEGQEDVLESLAEPVVEGVLLHHRVENRSHRLQALLVEGDLLRIGRESAGERKRDAPEQLPVVQHRDAIEERLRVLVHGERRCCRWGIHPANEIGEQAVFCRIGFELFLAAVFEFADHLQQHPGLMAIHLQRRHLGKRLAIVSHGFHASLTPTPTRVAQHELAVLGVTTGLVALQTGSFADLDPDFHLEEGGRGIGSPRRRRKPDQPHDEPTRKAGFHASLPEANRCGPNFRRRPACTG